MRPYKPRRSYIIQSGRKKDKSIEQLMFADFAWVIYMHSSVSKIPYTHRNRFHKHLLWVIAQSKKCQITKICHFCTLNPVTHFAVSGNGRWYAMNSAYTCCKDPSCKERLLAQTFGNKAKLLPIAFQSILYFQRKYDQQKVVEILKNCFGLPKVLTKKILFAFFAQ